jgi:hypothetical protein
MNFKRRKGNAAKKTRLNFCLLTKEDIEKMQIFWDAVFLKSISAHLLKITATKLCDVYKFLKKINPFDHLVIFKRVLERLFIKLWLSNNYLQSLSLSQ